MPPCKPEDGASRVAEYDVVPEAEKLSYKETTFELENMPRIQSLATPQYDPILKRLYIATTFACFFMIVWIMIAPASWLIRHSRFHREIFLDYIERQNLVFLVTPRSVVTKYQDQDLVHFTHMIPGAMWATIIPFQLHPTWRKNHKKMHRLLGYIFFAASVSISLGVFIIIKRKLTFMSFFPEVPKNWNHDLVEIGMVGMSLWFIYTALQAVQLARANKIALHQKWMYRHVASGIWVAVQRMLLVPPMVYYKITLEPPEKASQFAQREIFATAAELGWLICICLGEYANKRVASLQQSKKKVN